MASFVAIIMLKYFTAKSSAVPEPPEVTEPDMLRVDSVHVRVRTTALDAVSETVVPVVFVGFLTTVVALLSASVSDHVTLGRLACVIVRDAKAVVNPAVPPVPPAALDVTILIAESSSPAVVMRVHPVGAAA